MQYDLRKLTVDELAEEIEDAMEDEGWMTLAGIVEALELEDDEAGIESVRQALRWMIDRDMVQRGAFAGVRYYKV